MIEPYMKAGRDCTGLTCQPAKHTTGQAEGPKQKLDTGWQGRLRKPRFATPDSGYSNDAVQKNMYKKLLQECVANT